LDLGHALMPPTAHLQRSSLALPSTATVPDGR
jgi:hypothetical protein